MVSTFYELGDDLFFSERFVVYFPHLKLQSTWDSILYVAQRMKINFVL